MQEARDLLELQELIAQLGLTDDKRDSFRYKVNIPGNYYVKEGNHCKSLCTCRLVDISKKGASIEIVKLSFHVGATLHLLFPLGANMTEAVGRVIYINRTDSGYKVGLQSISEKDNIVAQLFN
jgi:hypothetical protein